VQCRLGLAQRPDKPPDGSPQGSVQVEVGASRPGPQVTARRTEDLHLRLR
jgi:hypothetical protein